MLDIGLRTELRSQLRTYATLLPLGLADLDRTVACEAADNPWLELIDRPLFGLTGDESRIAAPGPTLFEHLDTQLVGSGVRGPVLRAARYVIGALDDHAYLREDVASIAALAHVGELEASRAIALVQKLEPIGVAARSLGERFRLQLAEAGETASLAYRITFDFDEIAHAGMAAYATRHALATDELTRALLGLRACNPHPEDGFAPALDRIYPELIVTRQGEELQVTIDGRFWPEVRLAPLAVTRGLSEPMREARSRARLLVDALGRRKTTLERLAVALLDRQRRYFLGAGDAHDLVPLTGRDLARELGCAESTISRAIANRYAATPFGTIPLRALIVRRPATIGLTVAVVREHLRELAVASPALSDDALTRLLRLRGIRLARRTVAKYRGELGLRSSRTRGIP